MTRQKRLLSSFFITILAAFTTSVPTWAQTKTNGHVAGASGSDGALDEHSQKALLQTQQLLNDPEQRKKAAKENVPASAADDMVKAITNGNESLNQEVYALASDVFANIVKDAAGDPVKMKEAMDRFKRNPEAFANTWTPEQKKKLHELEEKLSPKPTKN